MTALCLKQEHHSGEFFLTNGNTLSQLAYGVVLAEDASEVTVGEENSAGAMPADQGRLLAKVGTVAGNQNLAGDAAIPTFASQTINLALSRAQAAFLED